MREASLAISDLTKVLSALASSTSVTKVLRSLKLFYCFSYKSSELAYEILISARFFESLLSTVNSSFLHSRFKSVRFLSASFLLFSINILIYSWYLSILLLVLTNQLSKYWWFSISARNALTRHEGMFSHFSGTIRSEMGRSGPSKCTTSNELLIVADLSSAGL